MQQINWGIIGCGDVTEVKSGPAFNKIAGSKLMAVMRRDKTKAEDYAKRHDVPKWYGDASELINDPAINAIYIATPPSSHEHYAIAALLAGKAVYVEKPMTADHPSAERMMKAVTDHKGKLVVAHYRRAQPVFKKIKDFLQQDAIGAVKFIHLHMFKKLLSLNDLQNPRIAWRVNPSIAGGGLFHDLAPHQLDILYHFFGDVKTINGMSYNQAGRYVADDIVAGQILFHSGAIFQGTWCFSVSPFDEKDECIIVGEKGSIRFSFFENEPVVLTVDGKMSEFTFSSLQHVQQPMIEQVVKYFRGEDSNPCSVEDGVKVMDMIRQFTTNRSDV
jgi:predicted dehydrogenase